MSDAIPLPAVAGAPGSARLCAAIDVGTNSVKLLVAAVGAGTSRRIAERAVVTRLGEGMQAQAMRLREAPMRRTLDALADLVDMAHQHGVQTVAAVGTAALRDAENRDEFLRRVRERCGLEIEVIAGEEEARLSYLAVRRDPQWRDRPRLLVIDIGGGSTEIIQGEPQSDRIAGRVSINLGAVRLTESYLKSDPPTITQLAAASRAAEQAFQSVAFQSEALHGNAFHGNAFHGSGLQKVARKGANPLEDAIPCEGEGFTVVGVGGTLTNLAGMDIAADHNGKTGDGQTGDGMTDDGMTDDGMTDEGAGSDQDALHGHRLTVDHLEQQIERLSRDTVIRRKEIPGLDPSRADIILGGAILLSQALARIGSGEVAVSTRGLRWGLLYDRFLER